MIMSSLPDSHSPLISLYSRTLWLLPSVALADIAMYANGNDWFTKSVGCGFIFNRMLHPLIPMKYYLNGAQENDGESNGTRSHNECALGSRNLLKVERIGDQCMTMAYDGLTVTLC